MVVPLSLPEDVSVIHRVVDEHQAALVILDPLVAFIRDAVNTHRDHHVRRVLAPMAGMAQETGAAVLVVIHTNKDPGTEPLMRISGSIGFTGAARAVLLAAEDPQDESRRILAVVKSNLAACPPPLAYRIVGVELPDGITTSKVEWQGEAPEVDPRELLVTREPEERTAFDEAVRFLREAGVDTAARPAKALEREAEDALGISPRTLRRARRALNIDPWKDGLHGGWYWGPKGTSEGDSPTPVPLAPSVRPAETPSPAPEGDRGGEFGGPALAKVEAAIRREFGEDAVEVVE
jgi:hypothetical protein